MGPWILAVLVCAATLLIIWPSARSSAALLRSAPSGGASSSSLQLIRKLGFTSPRWHLTLNSNFENQAPDPNIWAAGWFSPHSAISTTVNSTETACYDSSNIRRTSTGIGLTLSAVPVTCNGRTRPYTGALLSTNPYDGRTSGGFEYRYGIVQARIYLPGVGRGPRVADWPVFMTLGQPSAYGEDDVMEGLVGSVCSHYHSPSYSGYAGVGGCDHTLGPGWHTFTADWEPGSVTWYYDNKRYGRVTKGVSPGKMYIVLANTAAYWSQVIKPATMRVAYVKVWQRTAN